MGRYIEQNESRSELQQRIAADLRAKAAAKAKQEGAGGNPYETPDGVDDAAYLEGTKATTTLAPVWGGIAVTVILVIAFVIYKVSH